VKQQRHQLALVGQHSVDTGGVGDDAAILEANGVGASPQCSSWDLKPDVARGKQLWYTAQRPKAP